VSRARTGAAARLPKSKSTMNAAGMQLDSRPPASSKPGAVLSLYCMLFAQASPSPSGVRHVNGIVPGQFSDRLAHHASTARAELQKWGATKLWDDVWIVDMDARPETCLPGLVQSEAAVSIPLEGSRPFFSIGRAAGIAAQLVFSEKVLPRIVKTDAPGDELPRIHYCNEGPRVFEPVLARYREEKAKTVVATDLCRLMASHGSDKGIGWHTYTPFYASLFAERRGSVGALFEVGLGTNFEDVPSNMGVHGTPGASLRAWRDYFPDAHIYGADVDRRVLFSEDRIKTFFVDQLNPDTFEALWSTMSDVVFDLFIDDGLHNYDAAFNTLTHSIHKVKNGGFYVIEDVRMEDLVH